MTDYDQPSGLILVSSEQTDSGGPVLDYARAWHVFSQNPTAVYEPWGIYEIWHSETGISFPQWIAYDFGEGNSASLLCYRLTARIDYPPTAPSEWTMQGSNDGETWTDLDAQSGQSGWAQGEQRIFTLSAASAGYRFFRMLISASDGDAAYVNLAQLELSESVLHSDPAGNRRRRLLLGAAA